ncbi:hypothetical protein HKD37_14G039934 [Glycine soja]
MVLIQRTNRLRILCLNTLEGTSFVVQVEGTSTWVVVTENKRGYISCGSVQVEGTSTRLFKENKGGYIPCGSLLVKVFTRLKEISRTAGCLGTGCRHRYVYLNPFTICLFRQLDFSHPILQPLWIAAYNTLLSLP